LIPTPVLYTSGRPSFYRCFLSVVSQLNSPQRVVISVAGAQVLRDTQDTVRTALRDTSRSCDIAWHIEDHTPRFAALGAWKFTHFTRAMLEANGNPVSLLWESDFWLPERLNAFPSDKVAVRYGGYHQRHRFRKTSLYDRAEWEDLVVDAPPFSTLDLSWDLVLSLTRHKDASGDWYSSLLERVSGASPTLLPSRLASTVVGTG